MTVRYNPEGQRTDVPLNHHGKPMRAKPKPLLQALFGEGIENRVHDQQRFQDRYNGGGNKPRAR